MKVTVRGRNASFCELSPGDVFMFQDEVYMVLDSIHPDTNAHLVAHLKTGEVTCGIGKSTVVNVVSSCELFVEI